MARMCPWCLGLENRVIWLQPDRPCRRCKYVGDWDGQPVFTHPPKFALPGEATILALQTVEMILFLQDQPRMN